MFYPDSRWGAICPKTGRHFDFDSYYYIEREPTAREKRDYPDYKPKEQVYINGTLKFPKGNPSEVEITCPYCEDHQSHTFTYGQLSRPEDIAEKEREESEREIRQIEADAKIAEADVKKWEKRIKELEGQIAKDREYHTKMLHEKDKILDEHLKNLAESYMTLAKFVHDNLPQPSNAGKNPTYEETHS
jgi:hypothetical protein